MPENNDQGLFTRERILTSTLALATLLCVYVCYRIIKPFIPPIAFALALGVATHGPYRWLRRRIPNDTVSAAVAVVLVAILILGPISVLATYLVQDVVESINDLRAGTGQGGWRAVIERQPQLASLLHWTERRLDVEAQIRNLGEALASGATAFLGGSIAVATQLVITLFVLFFLYRDHRLALRSVRSFIPLSDTEANRMFSRVASTIRATVNGSITVALVQALLSGSMYVALGVPAAALWAAATFVAALVPMFGTVLIWGPITIYLLLAGSWIKAIILAAWGMLAVATIDNLLYPWLVGDKLRLHTVPTFFAIVGGIAAFGAAGLILGPLALAVTLGLLDIWWVRTSQGQPAEDAVTESRKAEIPPGEVLNERGVG